MIMKYLCVLVLQLSRCLVFYSSFCVDPSLFRIWCSHRFLLVVYKNPHPREVGHRGTGDSRVQGLGRGVFTSHRCHVRLTNCGCSKIGSSMCVV